MKKIAIISILLLLQCSFVFAEDSGEKSKSTGTKDNSERVESIENAIHKDPSARKDDGTAYTPDAGDRDRTPLDPHKPEALNRMAEIRDSIVEKIELWLEYLDKTGWEDFLKAFPSDPLVFGTADNPVSTRFSVMVDDVEVMERRTSSPEWQFTWTQEGHPNFHYVEGFIMDIDMDGEMEFLDRKLTGGYLVYFDANGNGKVDNGFEMCILPPYDAYQCWHRFGLDSNGDNWADEKDVFYKYMKAYNGKTGESKSLKEMGVRIRMTGAHRWGNDSPNRIGIYSMVSCYVDDDDFKLRKKEGRIVYRPFPTYGECIRFGPSNEDGIEITDPITGKVERHWSFGMVLGIWPGGIKVNTHEGEVASAR